MELTHTVRMSNCNYSDADEKARDYIVFSEPERKEFESKLNCPFKLTFTKSRSILPIKK